MESSTTVAKVIGEIHPVKELIRYKTVHFDRGILFKEKCSFEETDWEETKRLHEVVLKHNQIIPKDAELFLKLELQCHPSDLKWMQSVTGNNFVWKYQVVKKIEISLPMGTK